MRRPDPESLRLERRVAGHVAEQGVLRRGERALLMLSGGADSMALLAMLPRVDRRLGLGLEATALHVHYGTRGADSDRDLAIVERACAAAGVPLHVLRLRRPSGGDFQARAREARYGRARELAAEHGLDAIVTAHNRDDQAETILYRLAKYASPRGLIGMRPRDGDLARPLLCLGAAEIREYCRAGAVDYGDDATNAETVYARNKLRHDVLPRLAGLNPRLAETLSASSLQAAAEADVLAAATAAARARVVVAPGAVGVPCAGGPDAADALAGPARALISVAALADEPPALRSLLVHELLREAMGGTALVERRLVEAVLRLVGRTDDAGRVDLGRGLEAVRGGGRLEIRTTRPPHRCAPVTVGGAALAAAGDEGVALAFCGHVLRARLLPAAAFDRAAAALGQAFIGLESPPREVTLRHPARGDRFAPLGLGGETTVARYLAGARVPAPARPLAPVVDVDGRVAWVGYVSGAGSATGRVARSFRVAQSSVRILHVSQEGT